MTRTDVKALKMLKIERITAEAWQQDAVLTMLDLEWLLGVNGASCDRRSTHTTSASACSFPQQARSSTWGAR
ncbi:MAG: DUF1670 domain-containing protein [Firmicutes bacterium]|nr:DUF1670 domain-containing protein [Bacillota bacterium]